MSELTPEEIEMFFLITWIAFGQCGELHDGHHAKYIRLRNEYWANDPRIEWHEAREGTLANGHPLSLPSYLIWVKNRERS